MNETLNDIIREYIDFVNRQIGVYMDALAGFAGHHVNVERQVHIENRAVGIKINEKGERIVVCVRYEDPTKPDVILNRIIRASDYLAVNAKDGSNAQQHSQAVVVFLFSFWEEEIRPRIAASKQVELKQITSDIMGDLRILRHAVLHAKGMLRADKHKSLKVLNNMFAVDQPIHIPYENMHKIFELIKQDCARILGISNPETIKDIGIQRQGPITTC